MLKVLNDYDGSSAAVRKPTYSAETVAPASSSFCFAQRIPIPQALTLFSFTS